MKKTSNLNIQVNGTKVPVSKGELLIDVLIRNGIKVPTLCHMDGCTPEYPCRICTVYDENNQAYIPSCSTKVNEEMNVTTHSPQLLRIRRMLLEMLLSNHPDDCLYCSKNGNCELRHLAGDLNLEQRRFYKKEIPLNNDKSSAAIVREYAKCILCGKCVSVCNEIQGCNVLQFNKKGVKARVEPEFGKLLNQSACVFCGKCLIICPTASLSEKENITSYFASSDLKNNETVSVLSPLLEFDKSINELNSSSRSKENHALITISKSASSNVFSLNTVIDVYLMELLKELKEVKDKGKTLMSTYCPSAELYFKKNKKAEQYQLSKIKKPVHILQQILEFLKPHQAFQIHEFTTCLANKHVYSYSSKKISAYTVRELLKIRQLTSTSDAAKTTYKFEEPFHLFSGLSYLPFIAGGLTEALVRMLYLEKDSKELDKKIMEELRTEGDVRMFTMSIGKKEYSFGIVNGLKNIDAALKQWSEKHPDFIEVLACPDGCMWGGGASFGNTGIDVKSFYKMWYELSDKSLIRYPQRNIQITSICEEMKKKSENGDLIFTNVTDEL